MEVHVGICWDATLSIADPKSLEPKLIDQQIP